MRLSGVRFPEAAPTQPVAVAFAERGWEILMRAAPPDREHDRPTTGAEPHRLGDQRASYEAGDLGAQAADQSALIDNAVARQFIRVVEANVGRTAAGPDIDLHVISAGAVPTGPVSKRWWHNGSRGLLAGFWLALGGMALSTRWSRRPGS
jgi:NAD(P)-dependent dehydrogenase (short-subunit alcohol dehydrogenase family)